MYGFLPPNISTHGEMIDRIMILLHVFMAVLFIGWFAFFLYTLFKFRAREGHKANYAPRYTKFSAYLEIGIALFELVVLVFLAFPAWKIAKASIPSTKDALPIRVVAEQFAWNIHYPGPDNEFGRTDKGLISAENPMGIDPADAASKDDITAINTLNVPVNKKILIHLSSKDVIHSFGVIALRVKQDAVPGMTFPVYFEANSTGEFDIACSQLCGLGHYRMKGTLTVQKDDEFQSWLKEQKEMSGEME